MAKPIRRVGSNSRPTPIDTGIEPIFVTRQRIREESPDTYWPDDRGYVSDRNESLDAAMKLENDVQQIKLNIINFMKKYIEEETGGIMYRIKMNMDRDKNRGLDL